MSFLGLIAVLFIVFILVGVSLIGSFLRALFGIGRRTTTTGTSNNPDGQASNARKAPPRRKKYFSKDEGEYVEFEEV
ncbi:MAG: DUF4834 family protein [Prevotellaceae bacterium]|jgi:hypothetical protein|nr:DUF4834 family protein [Prevotellaceae bacterium]